MDMPTKEEVEAMLEAALVEFVQCRMTPVLYQEVKARIVAVMMKIAETCPMPDEWKIPCSRCGHPIEAGDLEFCTKPMQPDVVEVTCGSCKRKDETERAAAGQEEFLRWDKEGGWKR
jgi:hypothetical protein